LKKILGFGLAAVFAMSFSYVPAAFADAANGKKLFNTKTKTMTAPCKQCHKVSGDPNKFKPVGPGLKGVGKRHNRDWLLKWLSPKNVEIWEAKGDAIKDLMKRYSAAKKGKTMKKSQMVKNFGPGKKGKPPKITLTDAERNDIVDYLMTL